MYILSFTRMGLFTARSMRVYTGPNPAQALEDQFNTLLVSEAYFDVVNVRAMFRDHLTRD